MRVFLFFHFSFHFSIILLLLYDFFRIFVLMKIVLLVVGKTTNQHFISSIEEYCQRLAHYTSFEIDVIPELRQTRSLSVSQQKEQEGSLILSRIQTGDRVVLLDEHGVERRSVDFASWLEKRMASGARRILFIVGGPYGFSEPVYARADEKISLSQMTLSHQMIRLLFVEQLYRAFTILHHEPYHHE